MSIDVGAHLKAVRQMYGLSQRELAKRAGVTNGLISLIEQNRVSPSVSSLKKVLDGIPMALAEFFTLDLAGKPQVFFPREELADIGTPAWSCGSSAAAGEAQHVDPARALCARRRHRRGDADARGRGGRRHREGQDRAHRRRRIARLGAGDAYYFKSSLPHRFRNPGREECEIVSASSPPTF
jgi:transcriptional regulator with XRE-family HTH domain